MTEANALAAPFWNTRTVPPRSAKNSRPSGAKARAVAKSAAIVPEGGDCAGSAHGDAVVVVALRVVVVGAAVVVGAGALAVVVGAAVVDVVVDSVVLVVVVVVVVAAMRLLLPQDAPTKATASTTKDRRAQ